MHSSYAQRDAIMLWRAVVRGSCRVRASQLGVSLLALSSFSLARFAVTAAHQSALVQIGSAFSFASFASAPLQNFIDKYACELPAVDICTLEPKTVKCSWFVFRKTSI